MRPKEGQLEFFGAIPTESCTVVDEHLITTAGVTAGIEGALWLACLLRGAQIAQEIQLNLEYAPDPPFSSGSPESAPAEALKAVSLACKDISRARRHRHPYYAAFGH